MPFLGPVSRTDLIFYFKKLGFVGPKSGAKYQYMIKGITKVPIPNPHRGEIGRELLARILREAHIKRDEWEEL
jgi:hypothetical protein